MALTARMSGFRQLVCIVLLLPSVAVGQSAPATPPAGQKAAPAPLTAEEKKNLDGALLEAVEYDNRSEVQRLLAQGADPNARDEHGVTALMKSAEDMDAELARMLIAAGADVNARDAVGMTALLTAADDGSPEVLRLLLARRADVGARDANGWNAVILAADAHRTDLVRILLERQS